MFLKTKGKERKDFWKETMSEEEGEGVKGKKRKREGKNLSMIICKG